MPVKYSCSLREQSAASPSARESERVHKFQRQHSANFDRVMTIWAPILAVADQKRVSSLLTSAAAKTFPNIAHIKLQQDCIRIVP